MLFNFIWICTIHKCYKSINKINKNIFKMKMVIILKNIQKNLYLELNSSHFSLAREGFLCRSSKIIIGSKYKDTNPN